MYIIVIILFVIVVLLILERVKSFYILKMSFWLYISYSFLILTHLFSGIKYNTGNTFRILPYFLFCLLLIIIGEELGSHINSSSIKNKIKITLKTLCIISFLGSMMFIYDILRLNEVRFGFRIADMKISLFGVLGNIISSTGIIAWLYSIYEFRIHKLKISKYSFLALFSYISGGILSAGRAAIFMISISTIVVFLWSRRKSVESTEVLSFSKIETKKKSKTLYLFLILCISYFMMISNVRSGITDINVKIKVFEKGFSAKTSKSTVRDVHNLGFLSDIYLETLYYYSHELIRLDIFNKYYNFPPTFGLAQMGYVERRIPLFSSLMTKSRQEDERAVEEKGKFRSHTWGTFATHFIMDFGRVGALFACFFLGITVGILFKKFRKEINSSTVIRQALICTGIVFSIQVSPVTELIWMFPFVLSSFIKILPKNINPK